MGKVQKTTESTNIQRALEADLAGIDAALKKITDFELPNASSTEHTQFNPPKPSLADLEYGALKPSFPKLTREKSVEISDEAFASRTSEVIRGGKNRTAFCPLVKRKISNPRG
ncbi:MAG: hypothetical protein HYU97_08615 [Deltaproteobacteria bacterium]|nr:hypothetical protein [Deltaproteobacteria bacterium]